jgi:hypothetical protein
MVARRPVVSISGQQTELPPGDSIAGGSVGTLTAGSGLNGGGDLSSTTTVNVSLAPNPSGLILVDNKYLATDGVAQRTATTALESGNYSLSVGSAALASGIAGDSLATAALASGNAALAAIAAVPVGQIRQFTAASTISVGNAVGLDASNRVQSIRVIGGVIYPYISSQNNFIGVAQTSAASGSVVSIRLPGSYDRTNSGLTTGALYYVNPTTSGFTTTATQPAGWTGAVSWGPVGRAVNSTTLLLTDMI